MELSCAYIFKIVSCDSRSEVSCFYLDHKRCRFLIAHLRTSEEGYSTNVYTGKNEWSGYYHSNKSDWYHLHTFLAQSETDNWANH